ncbi:MAG TPA: 4-alpha-glucanotransferase, partial [Chitinophagaceae bacterium]|nr:4-alpha-glucanotransferase [Chitinophagaceae bacterium]
MKIDFFLRFHTKFGQQLALTGSIPELGGGDPGQALALAYYNEECWHLSVDIDPEQHPEFRYRYLFTDTDGSTARDGETERVLQLDKAGTQLTVIDTWNYSGAFENAFLTAPFQEVFNNGTKEGKAKKRPGATHTFKVKAPLLPAGQCICLLGAASGLGSWNTEQPLRLSRSGSWWVGAADLSGASFPLTYKYGIWDDKKNTFLQFEAGEDRRLFNVQPGTGPTIVHDGFVRLPGLTWKGAGVAIPVFSLKSANSFGVGEFSDIKLLVDWAASTGLKLIQLLPVNDTSASFTWTDSYPYAAISTFALHPLYINLTKVAGKKGASMVKAL